MGKTIYVCEKCGSDNIQCKAWVDLNTREFDDWVEGEDMYYCRKCSELYDSMPKIK